MNDFSQENDEFLYSQDYKDPIQFWKPKGSDWENVRILPNHVAGGESIQFRAHYIVPVGRGTSFFAGYCEETTKRVRENGRRALKELMEKYREEINFENEQD